jgi:hypothetical protein
VTVRAQTEQGDVEERAGRIEDRRAIGLLQGAFVALRGLVGGSVGRDG